MVTLANPGTVSLVCSAQALDSLTTPAYQLYGVTLTAIAVTLHDQSPV
jgi:hypothetical protein